MVPTTMYLATKIEECIVRADSVISYFQDRVLKLSAAPSPTRKISVADVLECELILLESINFEMILFDPYSRLSTLLNELSLSYLLQPAWLMMNDCVATFLPLSYTPFELALGVVFLICMVNEVDVTEWVCQNGSLDKIQKICSEMMTFYALKDSEVFSLVIANSLDKLCKKIESSTTTTSTTTTNEDIANIESDMNLTEKPVSSTPIESKSETNRNAMMVANNNSNNGNNSSHLSASSITQQETQGKNQDTFILQNPHLQVIEQPQQQQQQQLLHQRIPPQTQNIRTFEQQWQQQRIQQQQQQQQQQQNDQMAVSTMPSVELSSTDIATIQQQSSAVQFETNKIHGEINTLIDPPGQFVMEPKQQQQQHQIQNNQSLVNPGIILGNTILPSVRHASNLNESTMTIEANTNKGNFPIWHNQQQQQQQQQHISIHNQLQPQMMNDELVMRLQSQQLTEQEEDMDL
eukprot:TRINITY_DN5684_c0_g3_i1.p1 TRINITY_DN5684_c0_g3~~TRINITY_DN5684_c0_g3_i1.p1  ORF type:complete len:528 (+),score=172.73 TRINITY_DN5684_c0_g3_i1:195-1586(+)